MFSFVREAARNSSGSFGDLYEYFSGAMSSDTGVGGTCRRWLETESALSKSGSEAEREILRCAAVLGIGVSGERVRVRKPVLELAVSGFRGLSGEHIKRTVQNLIDRKLLLYRKRTDDVSVWHGTDFDIRGRLREEILKVESEFEAADVLSKEYPAPNWRPVAHNVKNAVRRFFAGAYLPAGELLHKRLAHPSLELKPGEDGRVIYCLAETPDELSRLASFVKSASETDPRIVFAVPARPVRIVDAALEIAALERLRKNHEITAADPFADSELRHMTDSAREELSRVMNRVVFPGPEGAAWFSKGRRLSTGSERDLYERLSEIADESFSSTPRINNELVVRGNVSRPIVNARKKLVLGILERSGEPCLGFERESTTPDVAMYRTVLEKTGLYGLRDGKWKWATPDSLEDEKLAEVWKIMKRFFGQAGSGKSPAEELFGKLELPPYGMRRGLMPIFAAAGLQAFGRAVVIKREGEYLPDILASEIEEFCFSSEKFTVDVLEVDETLSLYLRALIERFDGRFPVALGDLMRQFYDALEHWKAQLPAQALRSRYVSETARSFQIVLRKSEDPAVIALREFPRLAGTAGPGPATSEFVAELIREIEGIVQGYTAKAVSAARDAFGIAPEEVQNIVERAGAWSACFGEEFVRQSELDGRCRAVLTRTREATQGRHTEFSFVRILSSILLGKGFDQWDDSSPGEFASALRETVAKLERALLESSMPNESVLPLVDLHFRHLYGRLEGILGPEEAAERARRLLGERSEKNSKTRGGLKSDGTYERSA